MLKLKMETTTVHIVNYNDFDSLIHEVYGNKSYNFAASEEMCNDTMKEVGKIKKGDLIDEDDMADLEDFKLGLNHMEWSASTLLQDLCNRDIIPEGTYHIRVSW
jgi:hypothetical protein